MSPTSRQISENVVVLLHRLGMNQSDLARRVDMSRMVLSQRVNGRNEWRADEIGRISAALGVAPDELMGTLPDLKEWDRRRETATTHPAVRAAGGTGGGPRFLVLPEGSFDAFAPPLSRAKLTTNIMSDRSI